MENWPSVISKSKAIACSSDVPARGSFSIAFLKAFVFPSHIFAWINLALGTWKQWPRAWRVVSLMQSTADGIDLDDSRFPAGATDMRHVLDLLRLNKGHDIWLSRGSVTYGGKKEWSLICLVNTIMHTLVAWEWILVSFLIIFLGLYIHAHFANNWILAIIQGKEHS